MKHFLPVMSDRLKRKKNWTTEVILIIVVKNAPKVFKS